jgi:ABC-type multidrug transport system fused ATPase/permease subunit
LSPNLSTFPPILLSDLPREEEKKSPVTLRGCITMGDPDIEDVDLKWWRSQIGLAQQEPFVFNESIFTNVAYGLVGSNIERENEETKRRLVKEACIEAFADQFINRLPEVRTSFTIPAVLHHT